MCVVLNCLTVPDLDTDNIRHHVCLLVPELTGEWVTSSEIVVRILNCCGSCVARYFQKIQYDHINTKFGATNLKILKPLIGML